eukprot:5307215-Pyramimonas_sp.AAC.1
MAGADLSAFKFAGDINRFAPAAPMQSLAGLSSRISDAGTRLGRCLAARGRGQDPFEARTH